MLGSPLLSVLSLALLPVPRSTTERRLSYLLSVSAILLLGGCAYRFTNNHIIRPEGIETIAVEAVYDTSREVLSHEILWDELQQALAADGHLRLAPRQTADAILRAHLKTAQITPTGSITSRDDDERDPELFAGQTPPTPDKYRSLTHAGEIRDSARLTMLVEVEVLSLRTKEVLLKRTYSIGQNFRAVHAVGSNTNVTTINNDFLRYEEAVDSKMRTAAKDVSRRVVQDLLVK